MTEPPARGASSTATGVAYLRAAHQLLDAEPRILDDPVVLRLFDAAFIGSITARTEELQALPARGLRSHVVLRSRFAEDQLRDAAAVGVDQYVILGAGLDTFAFRQPAWAASLHIFEVDHPASQDAKRARLAAAGFATPDNLTFVAIDFEHEGVLDGLLRHGFDMARPAFFAWLGVTMYLTEDAIDDVLRMVCVLPKGTEIVLTFAPPEDGSGASAGAELATRAASVGEPWMSYFTPEAMERKLRTIGFSTVWFLTPDAAAARYFQDRRDALPPPRRINTAVARV